jgi:hypothetical protein
MWPFKPKPPEKKNVRKAHITIQYDGCQEATWTYLGYWTGSYVFDAVYCANRVIAEWAETGMFPVDKHSYIPTHRVTNVSFYCTDYEAEAS